MSDDYCGEGEKTSVPECKAATIDASSIRRAIDSLKCNDDRYLKRGLIGEFGGLAVYKPLAIGDRIIVDGTVDGINLTGKTGTIKSFFDGLGANFQYGIEFDMPFLGGHDLNGKGKDGHCFWSVFGDKLLLLEKGKNKSKDMSKLTRFVKNMVLSADERLLRKVGLKDECGDFTEEAKQIVLNKLTADNSAELISIAKELEKERKTKKDEDCSDCE